MLARPVDWVWSVVASGRTGPQWYVEAAPLVFRGAVDRLVGGGGRRWAPPGTDLLRAGDRAGFWEVAEAEHAAPTRRLVLRAQVRAPGVVELETLAEALPAGSTRLSQTTRFAPRGLAGAAYLLADLPAREAVSELTHRRLLSDCGQPPDRTP